MTAVYPLDKKRKKQIIAIRNAIEEEKQRERVKERVQLRDIEISPNKIKMELFPNADFYYKLVAKIENSYYSIFDGNVQYEIGKIMHEPVKSNHKGGFYVYATPQEAIFASIPYNKGGNYIAPRVIMKVLAWGEYMIYDKGKMSFSFMMPSEDIGIPVGYKSTKKGKMSAVRHAEDGHLLHMENKFKHNMHKSQIPGNSSEYEGSKFENYFKSRSSSDLFKLDFSPSKQLLKGDIEDKEVGVEFRKMVDGIERRMVEEDAVSVNREEKINIDNYDPEVVMEAKKLLKNLAGFEI